MTDRRREPEAVWLVDLIAQRICDEMCGRDPHPRFDRAEPVQRGESS